MPKCGGKPENLEGKKFGKLTVIKMMPRCSWRELHAEWLCECECGGMKVVKSKNLNNGDVKSCGCLRKMTKKSRKPDTSEKSRLRGVWTGMRGRCNNPNDKKYPVYGGRGITVCPEWDNFNVFLEWARENGYQTGLTLDRIDVNGNYEPDNVQFITRSENSRKRRNTMKNVDAQQQPRRQ